MREPRTCSIAFASSAVMLGLISVLLTLSATAQSNNGNYMILLGSGFLCDPGDSSTCPATVKANAGDTYEMSGAGTFDAQSKSLKVAGTYAHKSPNGNVLETGVWIGSELLSFDSYGAAPGALNLAGRPLGPPAMVQKRIPMARGPVPTGGLAMMRIRLLPLQGPPRNATIEVNYAAGDVPRERSVEGIRLKLDTSKIEYSEELGGRVMFLAMRPEANTPAKGPQEEKAPETSEQPQN